MTSDTQKILRGSGRLLRISTLSLGVLTPVLSFLANRLRAQMEAEKAAVEIQHDKELLATDTTALQTDLQNRLQTIGNNLSDVLTQIRSGSYNHDLQKRADELKERSNGLALTIAERGNEISQMVAERGGSLGQDLIERGSELSQVVAERGNRLGHNLVERSSDLSQTIAGRSSDLSQELLRRTRRKQLEQMQQKRNFWVAFGFGLGLTAAGIITFVLIRQRLQKQEEEEEPPIQLPTDNERGTIVVPPQATVPTHGDLYEIHPTGVETNGRPTAITEELDIQSQKAAAVPADAAFVGVADTKRYYPVATPLDQLAHTTEHPVDVIYFTSEQEAQRQGFQAANA